MNDGITINHGQQDGILSSLCDKCLALVEAELTIETINRMLVALDNEDLGELLCDRCIARIKRGQA